MNRRQIINKILHNHIDVNKYEDYTNYKKLITAIEEWHESEVKNLTIANVSNSEVALKAFVEEFVEAWEDGMGGDTDLYKKAKSLL